jgi:hypothetical protein
MNDNLPRGGLVAESSPASDELRRERWLVRSAGTISKPTMAAAFGLVFLLAGVGMAAFSARQFWGALLAGAGIVSVAWAIYVWMERASQRSG